LRVAVVGTSFAGWIAGRDPARGWVADPFAGVCVFPLAVLRRGLAEAVAARRPRCATPCLRVGTRDRRDDVGTSSRAPERTAGRHPSTLFQDADQETSSGCGRLTEASTAITRQ
jgi:hypothetical protein